MMFCEFNDALRVQKQRIYSHATLLPTMGLRRRRPWVYAEQHAKAPVTAPARAAVVPPPATALAPAVAPSPAAAVKPPLAAPVVPALAPTPYRSPAPTRRPKDEWENILERRGRIQLRERMPNPIDGWIADERQSGEPAGYPDALDIVTNLRAAESSAPWEADAAENWRAPPRAIVVDWLVDVSYDAPSYEVPLQSATLQRAVALLDRQCQCDPPTRENFQLFAATALFIAEKFEERNGSLAKHLIFICDGKYTKAQLLDCEARILTNLRFNVSPPIPLDFLTKEEAQEDGVVIYLLDLALVDAHCMKYPPSMLAAAAVIAAGGVPQHNVWPRTYAYVDLEEPVAHLRALRAAAPQYKVYQDCLQAAYTVRINKGWVT